MVERTGLAQSHAANALQLARDKRLLILQSPYYADIAVALNFGARAVLEDNHCTFDVIEVPGALELPQALMSAVTAGLIGSSGECGQAGSLQGARDAPDKYAGVIALGCVIRGETAHYDIVCNNTNHWLMETAIHHRIPLGNGVLTVDTHAQAVARAAGFAAGKGGDAARACLRLIWLQGEFAQHAGAAQR